MSGSFVRKSIGQALLIFLTSVVIFPILPRTHGQLGLGIGRAQTGYTEEVSVGEWTRFGEQGAGNVLLRLYPADSDLDLFREIPNGLLRGKVLSRFDGARWFTDPSVNRSAAEPDLPRVAARSHRVEVLGEPFGSEVLPVPYGTHGVSVSEGAAGEEFNFAPRRLSGGEWVYFPSKGRRLSYAFEFAPEGNQSPMRSQASIEPLEDDLSVPPGTRTRSLENLARRVFDGARTDLEKVRRMTQFYRNEGYRASLDEDPELAAASGLVRKAGHCELFASSMAILLRMSGVPARLVAGFRLSRSSSGGVLVVRSRDAHAWVEAHIGFGETTRGAPQA